MSQTLSRDPTHCPGYVLTSIANTPHGLKGNLALAGKPVNAYGYDVANLDLVIEYIGSGEILHVHILDSAKEQVQSPNESVLPRPGRTKRPAKPLLHFHHTAPSEPFAFWITTPDDVVVFDTRPAGMPTFDEPLDLPNPNKDYDSSAPTTTGYGHEDYIPVESQGNGVEDGGPGLGRDLRTTMKNHALIFEDQYLQLSTRLPVGANIYGLGEVVSTSGLRRDPDGTIATMWNRDSGGSPMNEPLYGAHPLYMEMRESGAHGVFLRNSHGMDVILRTGVLQYRVLGGTLDLYFMAGPTPEAVIKQYAQVAGLPAQMPFWSFGYHMCRWEGDFASVRQLRKVVEKMRDEGIPWETVWSDLDYMDGRRNWTFHKDNFRPEEYTAFVDWLHENHQRYVPLVDIAIGLDQANGDEYTPYSEGKEMGLFLRNPDGSEFVGQVWPGPAVFPDWTHPKTTGWWKKQHDDYRKVVKYDGIWLDMNEPSNFADGPIHPSTALSGREEETPHFKSASRWDVPAYAIHDGWKGLGKLTVSPSALNNDGTRLYDTHNDYGYQQVMVTHDTLVQQKPGERPFILSRASAPGLGRVSAHWLGDNRSTWASMRASLQGVIQFQLYQIPMVGPDACGMGPPSSTEELCNRWMQLCAFYPFFRNHNGWDTSAQEPYRWASVRDASKKVLEVRYRLMPVWEDLFARAHLEGTPVIRPLFFDFPDPRLLKDTERQFMVGNSILVSPVWYEGANEVEGHFPAQTKGGSTVQWRSWWDHSLVIPDEQGKAKLSAPLGNIPVHIRSGSILLVYNKAEYSMTETRRGDVGLIAHLQDGRAEGEYWMDDGMTIDGKFSFFPLVASHRRH